MSKQSFSLINPQVRQRAIAAIKGAPDGMVCEIKHRKRSDDQNAKLHAMFADVAKQVPFFGEKRDLETVKRLLVDAFARVKEEEGDPLQGHGYTLPSLDGKGVVQLGIQTRRLTVKQTAELIEFLYAWGVDHEVRWSERVDVPEWMR